MDNGYSIILMCVSDLLYYSGPLVKSAYRKNIFSYFSTKTYVVGTQKNRLDES